MSIHTQRVRRRTRALGSPLATLRATGTAPAVEGTLFFGSAVMRIGAHAKSAGITSIPHSERRVKTVSAAGRIAGFGPTETLHNHSATKRAHMGGTATNRKGRGQANG